MTSFAHTKDDTKILHDLPVYDVQLLCVYTQIPRVTL